MESILFLLKRAIKPAVPMQLHSEADQLWTRPQSVCGAFLKRRKHTKEFELQLTVAETCTAHACQEAVRYHTLQN